MEDRDKTREQLLVELQEAGRRISYLEQQHEIHRSFLTSIPDAIVMYDMLGRTLYVNGAFVEMFGWTMDDLAGKGVPYTPDSQREATMAKISYVVVEGGVVSGFESTRYTKDGRLLDVSLSASRFNDHEGNPAGMVVILRNISETKRAEKALKESEAGYRAIFDSMNDAIFVHDMETGQILDVNRKMREMYGYAAEEARTLSVDEISLGEPPYSRHEALCRIKKAVEGEPQLFEWLCKDKQGRLFWVEVNLKRAVIGGEDRVLAVARDITERRAAEESLRHNEELQRTILDASPVGIALAKDRKIVWVNDAWIRIYGFEADDTSYLNGCVRGLYPTQEECERVGKIAYCGLETGQVNQVDAKMVRKDASVFDCHITLKAIDPSDLSKGTIATIMDITARKQAEEKLRESEERYRNLFENAPVGVFQTTVDGRFLTVNPAHARMFGYDSPEDVMTSVSDIARDLWVESGKCQAVVEEALAHDRAFNVETVFRRKDGSTLFGNLYFQVVRNDDRSVRCLEGFVEDISARKRAEEEKEGLRNQLLQAQKMQAVGTLTGGIAHDFNNMLTIILGYSELLLDETAESDPKHKDLRRIVQTARNGAELVQRLLMFSRQSETRPRRLNLNDRLRQINKLLSKTISKMVEINLILSDDLAPVMADPAQMDQIVMNLALNAGEAMPGGGKLIFETRNVVLDDRFCRARHCVNPGAYVALRVSDTGRGISKELMDRIFDPFFTTKGWDFRKGTGLGLSIVQGVVQQHRGFIECFSEPGKGTVFDIYLPVINEDASSSERTGETSLPEGSETILLVDDDASIRDLGKRFLNRAGYTVLEAGNGIEALALYRTEKERISLIILDLVMPLMGGSECLKELLKLNPKVKVLIATGYASGAAEKGPIDHGATGFVRKPFDTGTLLRAVRDSLDEGHSHGHGP